MCLYPIFPSSTKFNIHNNNCWHVSQSQQGTDGSFVRSSRSTSPTLRRRRRMISSLVKSVASYRFLLCRISLYVISRDRCFLLRNAILETPSKGRLSSSSCGHHLVGHDSRDWRVPASVIVVEARIRDMVDESVVAFKRMSRWCEQAKSWRIVVVVVVVSPDVVFFFSFVAVK